MMPHLIGLKFFKFDAIGSNPPYPGYADAELVLKSENSKSVQVISLLDPLRSINTSVIVGLLWGTVG